MDIRLLRTKKIVLFNEDDVFYPAILNVIKTIHLTYAFQAIKKDPDNATIVFSNGFLEKDGIHIYVEALSIFDRKIILCTNQETRITNKVLNDLISLLNEHGVLNTCTPIIETYETITVFESGFTMDDVFAKFSLNNFLSTVEKCNSDIEDEHILKKKTHGNCLKILIDYEDHGNLFKKKGITVSDKYITIEKRRNTDPGEKVLFASSPFKYDEHIKIIESLESDLR